MLAVLAEKEEWIFLGRHRANVRKRGDVMDMPDEE